MNIRKNIKIASAALALLGSTMLTNTAAAQTHIGDVIIDGSLCAGLDCAVGESFGFDTFRLKENNLRLHFDDTSASASFPANDWRIVANDSANGGANYLAFEDSTAGNIPFKVAAGAGANALLVRNNGNVGLGTASPVVELHISDGDSPALRLEQSGVSGFTPQTWDIAGNETNFFVRDVTNGSTLPFKIKPSAPSNSIFIDPEGDVGMGTQSLTAAADLHIRRSGGVIVHLDDTSSSIPWNIQNIGGEFLLTTPPGGATEKEFVLDVDGNLEITGDMNSTLSKLSNSGAVYTELTDTSTGTVWNFANIGSEARIISPSVAGVEFAMDINGNVTIMGSITTGGVVCAGGCDAVFNEDYDLPSIEEHAKSMFANKHLPAIGATSPNTPVNLSDQYGNLLNELEKAHIYIAQQQQEIAEIKTQLAHSKAQDARLARLEMLLSK